MESSSARAVISCFLAVMMVVGFTAAPAVAVDGDDGISIGDDDGISIDIGDDTSVDDNISTDDTVDDVVETPSDDEETASQTGPLENETDEPFPEEVCTDLGDQAEENVPFGELPWFDDLPEEAQPPGVPTDIVTPEAVAAIVFGATPNQCEVQDPNDPSYDPVTGDDEVDPAYDDEVQYLGQNDGGVLGVVLYEVTLNESGEGPGTSGVVAVGANPDYGDTDLRFAVSDGEKEYAVDPRVRYWEDGSAYTYTDIEALNSRLGVEVRCDGQECQPGTRGLPQFADYPTFPAPTGEDDSGDDSSPLCTDLGDQAEENVPFGEIPYFDDLPEEAQPPGVPTDIVTPEAVAAIVFGATPNQCEVQDPNDPSYDPVTGDDEVDPAYDDEVQYLGQNDGGVLGVVLYEVTLNESGEGPGTSGVVALGANPDYGDNQLRLAVNDGEKDYAVEPRVRYWEDGSAFTYTDVEALNSRLGVEVRCDGQECQPGTRGLPQFQDYPAFPAPTGDDGGDGDDGEESGPFPSEVCTDVGDRAQENIPFSEIPYFDDLPEEAQPPGVPTDIVTPEAVAAIVFGATPNQCEVQDPNDPTYNPATGDDEVDPGYDEEVQYLGQNDGGVLGVVLYEVTLNESGEGPGTSGVVALGANPDYGDIDLRFAVNDGEKDYAVDPRVRYWEDGSAYTYTDVEALNSRLGVEVRCDGQECQPGTRGLPQFQDYPAFPAPTGDDE